MYDFDATEVRKEIELDHLPFETKLPTQVPFKNMSLLESGSDGKTFVKVTLFNKDKNVLDFRISSNGFQYTDDTKKTRIGKNIDGMFVPDEAGNRILSWQDEGIYYEIIYYPKLTPKELSKNQLVKMAESFK